MNSRASMEGGGKNVSMDVFREILLTQYAECFHQENAAEKLVNLREVKGKHIEMKSQFELLMSKLPSDPTAFKECVSIALFRKALHPTTAKRCLVDSTGAKHTVLRELQTGALLGATVQKELDDAEAALGKPSEERTPRGPAKRKFSSVSNTGPRSAAPLRPLVICHNCGKKGHVASVCRSAAAAPPPPPGGPPRGSQKSGKGRPRR